jgi:hypothetical protein
MLTIEVLCYLSEGIRSPPVAANNPLHRTGLSSGRAVDFPSAMCVRLVCPGALVRQPVSRELGRLTIAGAFEPTV